MARLVVLLSTLAASLTAAHPTHPVCLGCVHSAQPLLAAAADSREEGSRKAVPLARADAVRMHRPYDSVGKLQAGGLPGCPHGAQQAGHPYEVVVDGQLVAGKESRVTLVGFGPEGADFKGYLVQPSSGVLSGGSSGAPWREDRAGECGWGHTEPGVKMSVSWTFVPADDAKEVSFSGFVMKDVNSWYKLSTTLAVTAN